MTKRISIVTVSLIGLFLTAQVSAIGPNFYLVIDGSLIAYGANFSVSDGNSVVDLDFEPDSFGDNPGGDEFHFNDTSSSANGTMTGTAHAEIWWNPGLDGNDRTEVSNAHAYLVLTGTTTSATATCTNLAATASCDVEQTGVRVSDESWEIAIGFCAFETLVAGAVSNGNGAVAATIGWGDGDEFANIVSQWNPAQGYTTAGFYSIDGVPEMVGDSSSGLTQTATIIIEDKGSSGVSNTIGEMRFDHRSVVTSNGAINTNGSIGLEAVALTSTGAYGIAP